MEWQLDERLILQQLSGAHAEEMFATIQQHRTYLRQWLPWVDGTKTILDTQQFIAFTEKQFAVSGIVNMAILYDGHVVGTIGTHAINRENRSTSIGYWLAADFQQQGIMTRSVARLVDYLFDTVKLHRIEIRAAVANKGSRAIPERLGFTNEGIAREAEWLYDHFVDHAVYSLLEGEWS